MRPTTRLAVALVTVTALGLPTAASAAAGAEPAQAAAGTAPSGARAAAAGATVPVAVGDTSTRSWTVPLGGVARTALGSLAVPVVDPEGDTAFEGKALAAAGDGLAVLTAARATDTFDVVGVAWDDDTVVESVLVRARVDGTWTDWTSLEVDGVAPEAGTAEAGTARGGTEPYVAIGADGVQWRVHTASGAVPAGLAATFVDTHATSAKVAPAADLAAGDAAGAAAAGSGSASADDPAADDPSADDPTADDPAADDPADGEVGAAGGVSPDRLRPAIVTRAQWGADESLRKPIAWNSTIKAVVVHHTATANGYTRAQAPAIIRGVYVFHIKGRGWSDIGYHFLVDRFGTVYEGRKGSLDKVPLGVHTGGFNTHTIGVSIIGDYTQATPSAATLAGVAQVAAWKLATFERDPLGTTVLTARSGSTHPVKKPGWTGSVPVILGHRDLGSTACPGKSVHSRLGTIRSAAAEQVKRVAATGLREYAEHGTDLVVHYYHPSASSWTATVRGFCDDTVLRTLSGKGSRWVPVAWNQLTESGERVPRGLYRVKVTHGTVIDEVVVEAVPDGGAGDETCGLTRLGGADRYATAVAVGRAASDASDDVVIVAGTQESLVDGLVAGPFARTLGAPVLLTTKEALPAATSKEVTRRAPSTAWIVGGTGVVSSDVAAQLKKLGVAEVHRLAGADRYGTAVAVAKRMPDTGSVVVASGAQASLIDAAGAGGAAAATGQPVLLTKVGGLPAVTRDLVAARSTHDATIVGGSAVVSATVADQLRALTDGTVQRFGGADRYATAVEVARGFHGRVPADRVAVANGSNTSLIDAVTGGALGEIILLVPGATGDPRVASFLNDAKTAEAHLLGGPGVVSPRAAGELVEAMR